MENQTESFKSFDEQPIMSSLQQRPRNMTLANREQVQTQIHKPPVIKVQKTRKLIRKVAVIKEIAPQVHQPLSPRRKSRKQADLSDTLDYSVIPKLNIHVDQDGKDIVAISPGLIMSPKFKKSALTVGSSLGIELEPVKVQPEAPKTPLFKPSPRTVLKQANRDAVSDGLDVLEKEIAYQLDKQKQLELKEWERKRKRDERIRLSAEAKAIEEAKLKIEREKKSVEEYRRKQRDLLEQKRVQKLRLLEKQKELDRVKASLASSKETAVHKKAVKVDRTESIKNPDMEAKDAVLPKAKVVEAPENPVSNQVSLDVHAIEIPKPVAPLVLETVSSAQSALPLSSFPITPKDGDLKDTCVQPAAVVNTLAGENVKPLSLDLQNQSNVPIPENLPKLQFHVNAVCVGSGAKDSLVKVDHSTSIKNPDMGAKDTVSPKAKVVQDPETPISNQVSLEVHAIEISKPVAPLVLETDSSAPSALPLSSVAITPKDGDLKDTCVQPAAVVNTLAGENVKPLSLDLQNQSNFPIPENLQKLQFSDVGKAKVLDRLNALKQILDILKSSEPMPETIGIDSLSEFGTLLKRKEKEVERRSCAAIKIQATFRKYVHRVGKKIVKRSLQVQEEKVSEICGIKPTVDLAANVKIDPATSCNTSTTENLIAPPNNIFDAAIIGQRVPFIEKQDQFAFWKVCTDKFADTLLKQQQSLKKDNNDCQGVSSKPFAAPVVDLMPKADTLGQTVAPNEVEVVDSNSIEPKPTSSTTPDVKLKIALKKMEETEITVPKGDKGGQTAVANEVEVIDLNPIEPKPSSSTTKDPKLQIVLKEMEVAAIKLGIDQDIGSFDDVSSFVEGQELKQDLVTKTDSAVKTEDLVLAVDSKPVIKEDNIEEEHSELYSDSFEEDSVSIEPEPKVKPMPQEPKSLKEEMMRNPKIDPFSLGLKFDQSFNGFDMTTEMIAQIEALGRNRAEAILKQENATMLQLQSEALKVRNEEFEQAQRKRQMIVMSSAVQTDTIRDFIDKKEDRNHSSLDYVLEDSIKPRTSKVAVIPTPVLPTVAIETRVPQPSPFKNVIQNHFLQKPTQSTARAENELFSLKLKEATSVSSIGESLPSSSDKDSVSEDLGEFSHSNYVDAVSSKVVDDYSETFESLSEKSDQDKSIEEEISELGVHLKKAKDDLKKDSKKTTVESLVEAKLKLNQQSIAVPLKPAHTQVEHILFSKPIISGRPQSPVVQQAKPTISYRSPSPPRKSVYDLTSNSLDSDLLQSLDEKDLGSLTTDFSILKDNLELLEDSISVHFDREQLQELLEREEQMHKEEDVLKEINEKKSTVLDSESCGVVKPVDNLDTVVIGTKAGFLKNTVVDVKKGEGSTFRLRLLEVEERLKRIEKTQRLQSEAQIMLNPDVNAQAQKQEIVIAQVQDSSVAAEASISVALSNQPMADQRIDTVEYEEDFDDCLSIGSMPINPLYLEKLKREKREVADQQIETVPQALVSLPIPSAENGQHQEERESKAEVVASRIDVETINNALTESRSIPVPVGSMPINPEYLEKLEREKRELEEQQRETIPQALVSLPIPSAEREHHQEERESKAEVVALRIDVDTMNNVLTQASSIPVPAEAEVQMEEITPEPTPNQDLDFMNSVLQNESLQNALVQSMFVRMMGSVADIVAPSEQVTQSKKTKRKHDIPMPQQLEISLQYAIQQLDICLPDNAEGFAQCPEIPATMMDAMNDSITKDARMLIFDSLVEVAEDLFCQHDRYNAPGRDLALHHIPKPTNISKKRLIAHCEKELQALMKLGETTKADYHYDATVQKITNDTANVIANGYCNLEVDEIYVREQLVQALWDKMLKETAQDMFKS